MQVDFLLLEYLAESYTASGLAVAVVYRRTSQPEEVRYKLKKGWLKDVRRPDHREYIKLVLAELQSNEFETRSEAWIELEHSARSNSYVRAMRIGTCDEQQVEDLLKVHVG